MVPAFVQWLIPLEQFFVDPEMRGRRSRLHTAQGVIVEIEVPPDGQSYTYVAAESNGVPSLIGVRNMWVRARLVNGVNSWPSAKSVDQEPTPAQIEEAQTAYALATDIAAPAVDTFMDMAAHQTRRFLGRLRVPFIDVPPQLWIGRPPRKSKIARGVTLTVVAPGPGPGLGLGGCARVRRALRNGTPPVLAWQVFGRAWRLFFLDRDYRRAVIEGTIAMEVGLDAAYRRIGERRQMGAVVQLILKRVQTLPVQLTDGAAAVLGSSYAAINQQGCQQLRSLAERRNDIVHNGAPPGVTEAELSSMLLAVKALLEWLDTL